MAHSDQALKQFAMTSQLIEHDLDRIEREHGVDLGRGHRAVIDADEVYYLQIEGEIRAEAAQMAPHYEVFYSLETTIRRLVADSLEAADGEDWWNGTRVHVQIKQSAEKRQTMRSIPA